MMQNQAQHSDFAILYRTNAQSRSFEEALRRLNIPYKIYGGISFYQRKEVKDALSYFRLSINNHDDESLRRIINYPARGIGQTTIDKIAVAAAEHDISMWSVISNLRDFNLGINSGISGKIGDFVTQIKSFNLLLPYKDAFELANHILVSSGIVKELYNDKTPEGVSRYENIQELLNGIKDFVEQQRSPQESELNDIIKASLMVEGVDLFPADLDKKLKTLDEFMQEITLLTSVDNEDEKDTGRNKVSLMTIHAAKGLEFPYVYIVGLEENLFPSQLSINSRSELEEERRLFYVAVTRAEKQATLSYATMRYRFGNVTYCEPSRFIDEIDDKFLDYPEEPGAPAFSDNLFERFRQDYNSPGGSAPAGRDSGPGIRFNPPAKKLVKLGTSLSSNAAQPDLSVNRALHAGDEVLHEKFGKGKILALEGPWPETKAVIQFEKAGSKSLLLKFARLSKV
jgi:DNA helicase II / ATP-dependent DNA helicase PcrA